LQSCSGGRIGNFLESSFNDLEKISQNENLQNNGFLVVHLRMTGYFKFIENSIHPCKHTRIRFFNKKKF